MPDKYRAAFDLAWRTMRDRYYDGNLGNRNWDAIRRKYADMAAQSPDRETFGTVVNLMLGELNGSHLGFTPTTARAAEPEPEPRLVPTPATRGRPPTRRCRRRPVPTPDGPSPPRTSGSGSSPSFEGPGLKVRDVIPDTPADHKATRILPGEVLVAVDGTQRSTPRST